MKKAIILSCALLAAGATFAQSNYPCVINDEGSWKLSEYDAENNTFLSPSLDFGNEYVRNTFVKFPDIEQYGYATFDGTSSTVHIQTSGDGHYTNVRPYEHVLSLSYAEKTNQLIYLATKFVPNYYDFLSEDVSINIIDITKNDGVQKVTIPTFSVNVPTLPFIGTKKRKDRLGVETNLSYSISLPTINTDRSEFIFVAKDIPGANRLVKMNLESRQVETILVDADVLSVVYCPKTKTLKALVYETSISPEFKTSYFVADLDDRSALISNKVLIATSTGIHAAEQNGDVEYQHKTGTIVVTKEVGSEKMVFELNAETNEVVTEKVITRNADISVPLPFDATRNYSLGYHTKMYPNPTQGSLTITTTGEQVIDEITVTDAMGRAVKRVAVQSGFKSNDIDISALRAGVYYVKVSSGEETHVEKVVKY